MNRDWVPLGVGRNGLGGHIMVRRQITPHNPIRDMAAAPTSACGLSSAVSSST
jgi:hypothetical protein